MAAQKTCDHVIIMMILSELRNNKLGYTEVERAGPFQLHSIT